MTEEPPTTIFQLCYRAAVLFPTRPAAQENVLGVAASVTNGLITAGSMAVRGRGASKGSLHHFSDHLESLG